MRVGTIFLEVLTGAFWTLVLIQLALEKFREWKEVLFLLLSFTSLAWLFFFLGRL